MSLSFPMFLRYRSGFISQMASSSKANRYKRCNKLSTEAPWRKHAWTDRVFPDKMDKPISNSHQEQFTPATPMGVPASTVNHIYCQPQHQPFSGMGGFYSSSTPFSANYVTVPSTAQINLLEDRIGMALQRLSLLERKVDRHHEEISNLDKSMSQMVMNDDDKDSDEEDTHSKSKKQADSDTDDDLKESVGL